MKLLVIECHRPELPEPISFRKGAFLVVGDEYSGPEGWPGWYSCSTEAQQSGWVPAQVFERIDERSAIAIADYSSVELSVDPGDILFGQSHLNEWTWCRKQGSSEAGWVPTSKLERMPG